MKPLDAAGQKELTWTVLRQFFGQFFELRKHRTAIVGILIASAPFSEPLSPPVAKHKLTQTQNSSSIQFSGRPFERGVVANEQPGFRSERSQRRKVKNATTCAAKRVNGCY